MPQQLLTESLDETKPQIARRRQSVVPARFFQGGSRSPVLQLQRALGNQRVAQLIQAKRLTPEGRIIGLQPKSTVGAADDQYEREADRVARQVVSMPAAVSSNPMQRAISPAEEDKDQTTSLTEASGGSLQRQPVNEESEPDGAVQRTCSTCDAGKKEESGPT